MKRNILIALAFASPLALAIPVAVQAQPGAATTAKAPKPPQHTSTIKKLELGLGRPLTEAEKKKVRDLRDKYDRDLAGTFGLTFDELTAKTKAAQNAARAAARAARAARQNAAPAQGMNGQ